MRSRCLGLGISPLVEAGVASAISWSPSFADMVEFSFKTSCSSLSGYVVRN